MRMRSWDVLGERDFGLEPLCDLKRRLPLESTSRLAAQDRRVRRRRIKASKPLERKNCIRLAISIEAVQC